MVSPTASRAERVRAYLHLLRPANIVTAWADILAGYAVVIAFGEAHEVGIGVDALWLLVATTGLYGGGVVFNDVFDAELDARERPERPIPSGHASRRGAALLGAALLAVGVVAAYRVTWISAILAAGIAAGAVLYDARGKHYILWGPLNMGACRGGNLLLGVSAIPALMLDFWFLALVPVAYIAAITAISQGEVHGGERRTGVVAVVLVVLVVGSLLAFSLFTDHILDALPFAALLAWRVGPPFVKAARTLQPRDIRAAVRSGVLSLIVVDAALAACLAGWVWGLAVLALWPVSAGLARLFAVT